MQSSSRGYIFEADLATADVVRLCQTLLVDSLVEEAIAHEIGTKLKGSVYTVLLKPGVMDPVAGSVEVASRDLELPVRDVQTFRRYFGNDATTDADRHILFEQILANDSIEQIVVGTLEPRHLTFTQPAAMGKRSVKLAGLDDDSLLSLSKGGMLALNVEEMRTIQQHFAGQDRDPTTIELETIAQTWSEHCSHKTLKGEIEYTETIHGVTSNHRYKNMLKETIFAATQSIRKSLGDADWCVSVFEDNAGIVTFNDDFHVCFKVETHNRPSALEPYGGANTGIGGVIRDVLGTGLGGRPVCNTDVFCFAPLDTPPDSIPQSVIHPRRVVQGVVAGVRDYGNRMGIPTVNGAILFDERYLANPLVFCGTVGLIPKGMEFKLVSPGELIVAVGGLTGRDGIHGATFSSEKLTDQSDVLSGGAVQIGNPIMEKKVADVILRARDQGLYTALTDCGAGGFSSAIGEMAEKTGAEVQLENAPLKYAGLSFDEIWISESQERMVLSVPTSKWNALKQLCNAEDVPIAKLGTFTDSGRLLLTFQGETVGELDMQFLHDGRPKVVRSATWHQHAPMQTELPKFVPAEMLLQLLGSPTIASKEWVIRQYDHEVQAGSVIKPLVGIENDGPSDAAVIAPILGHNRGIAVGCGINPRFADIDPYAAAASAIDEAVRNVVAVGADPERIAILDNFCWGNANDPEMLGALVRTAKACQDVAIAYGTPFISGKDSLHNEFRSPDRHIRIPHTLLISALGQVPDIHRCVTMDLKQPDNDLYLVGLTDNHFGGSELHHLLGLQKGSTPNPNLEQAPKIFAAIHQAISTGKIRSCHDLSEGGLAVAIAEMAFAGNVGATITLDAVTMPLPLTPEVTLFSESPTRFLIEALPEHHDELAKLFEGLPFSRIGTTHAEPTLEVHTSSQVELFTLPLSQLKKAWQEPLRL